MSLEYREHPILKPPPDEEQLWMLENDQEAYLQSIKLHNDRIEASVVDPVYNSFVLPQQEKVRDLLLEDHIDEAWVLGGNRCLAGEQEIYDLVQQKSLRQVTEAF